MGFTDAHRPIKHKILFPWDKLKGVKSLPAECREKLYAVIDVTLKSLIDWKPSLFD